MHYELYLDSLFLLNFGMNLLLLCLVDHSMGHTATWYRLLAGAVVGAVWYLFPFLWKGTAAGKLLLCFLPGTILMLYVTFHIRSLGTLWNYFRKLMLSTFLIGGILTELLVGNFCHYLTFFQIFFVITTSSGTTSYAIGSA
jgi:stage II sporulation protein GA (sporulation sigma-E factor processing peptidase)